MEAKIKDIEFPTILIREVTLSDNKIIVTLSRDRNLNYSFNDYKSAERVYKNIVERLKKRCFNNNKMLSPDRI